MADLKALKNRQKIVQIISRMATSMKMVARSRMNTMQKRLHTVRHPHHILLDLAQRLVHVAQEEHSTLWREYEYMFQDPRNHLSPAAQKDTPSLETLGRWDIHGEEAWRDFLAPLQRYMTHDDTPFGPSSPTQEAATPPSPDVMQDSAITAHEAPQRWLSTHHSLSQLWGKKRLPTFLPYLARNHKNKPWVVVVLTADNGLCGGFNQRLVKCAKNVLSHIRQQGYQTVCISAGRKGVKDLRSLQDIVFMSYEYALQQKDNLFSSFQRTVGPEGALYTSANKDRWQGFEELCQYLLQGFVNHGHISGVSLVYSKFHNILQQEPAVMQLLPFVLQPNPQGLHMHNHVVQCQSSVAITLEAVLGLLFSSHIHYALSQHKLSEHSARITAMDGAQNNAKDMMTKLQIAYNGIRQALITKELSEIISGSEATSAILSIATIHSIVIHGHTPHQWPQTPLCQRKNCAIIKKLLPF